jgi:hypothetical protein
MRRLLKALAPGIVFLSGASSFALGDEARPTLLFSYEVINFDVHKIDPAKLSYDKRVALTEAARRSEIPKILAALKLPVEKVSTLTMPGGKAGFLESLL